MLRFFRCIRFVLAIVSMLESGSPLGVKCLLFGFPLVASFSLASPRRSFRCGGVFLEPRLLKEDCRGK